MDGVGHARMTTCSIGLLCKKKVVVSVTQIVESIKVDIVTANAFVIMVCGTDACLMWCTLVQPVLSQATGVCVNVEYAALCTEYQGALQEPGMPP